MIEKKYQTEHYSTDCPHCAKLAHTVEDIVGHLLLGNWSAREMLVILNMAQDTLINDVIGPAIPDFADRRPRPDDDDDEMSEGETVQ